MLLDHPSCFFVCLATFKIKQIFRLSFLHSIKRKRARKVPVRRSILLAAKKLKTRCVSSSSIHSFVVLFNPPREGERKREKERESDRRLCVRCFSCCAQLRFFLFPENLSSFLFFFVFFFRSARRLNAMRERERENHR